MLLRTLTVILVAASGTLAVAAERQRKVLIIGVDGCRPDCLLAAETPNYKALGKNGLLLDEAQTGDITVSGPGWSSMLTGVWRGKHGVRANDFQGSDFERYPHFFTRLREVSPDLKLYSTSNWDPIDKKILSGASASRDFQDDDGVEKQAIEYLAIPDADIVFAAFDDVDHAGHATGFSRANPKYLSAIETIDARVGRILAALKSRPSYAKESWLILSTTDHGGSGTGHGQNIPEHRTIFLLVSGDDVAKVRPTLPAAVVDVPALVAAHLGVVPKPEWGWDGVPVGLQKTGAIAAQAAALLGEWRPEGFDAAAGRLKDSAGGHDGEVSGAITIGKDGTRPALELNGKSSLVVVPDVAAPSAKWLPKREFSVTARVRIDKRQRWGGIVSCVQDDADTERGWVLGYDDAKLSLAVSTKGADDGNGLLTYLTSRTNYETGQWYSVAGTYDGQVMRLYVDGKLEAVSRAQTDDLLLPPSSPFVLGAYRDQNEDFPLQGGLGRVRLYRGVLSDAEIGDQASSHDR